MLLGVQLIHDLLVSNYFTNQEEFYEKIQDITKLSNFLFVLSAYIPYELSVLVYIEFL